MRWRGSPWQQSPLHSTGAAPHALSPGRHARLGATRGFHHGLLIAATAALAGAAAPASAELELSFDAGRVTVVASDVPLAAILAAWKQVGHTRFVAADSLPARPVSVHMENVPEREALRVLLRAAGGYIAAPREAAPAAGQPGRSAFAQVLIMPPGRARARPAGAGPAPFEPPAGRSDLRFSTPGAPGPDAEALEDLEGMDDMEDAEFDSELDDLDLLDLLRRRYESVAAPVDDAAAPAFFPSPAPGASAVGAGTSLRPGVILQPDDPPPQPRSPANRARRRTRTP